jgi:hypothetical protein
LALDDRLEVAGCRVMRRMSGSGHLQTFPAGQAMSAFLLEADNPQIYEYTP